ncbi:MAG: E7 protein [Varecia variegata papillomavirus 2]|nr:MAG: E7 protein [Varecia variegata papillomavirus 2]UXR08089.1 MAG: E7 protein [Varecia variegata papillomavirus 2]WPK29459.1 MAG: E7 protein [Varecia variegata papillomavirus 2]WPK29465.1 MAG: E7 protein [Varecia variegata papillomavirus 2]
MIGKQPTIRDVELVLHDLSPPDVEPPVGSEAESTQWPYRITTYCHGCNQKLRLVVVAGDAAVLNFEQLLLEGLNLLCPDCSRQLSFGNGRR